MGSPGVTTGPGTSDLPHHSSEMASPISHWLRGWKVMLSFLILLSCLVNSTSSRTSYSRCLRTCVHCKQMYGKFFLGHLCAQTCISKHGNFKAVCTDIHSIKPFLDMASLMDYDSTTWSCSSCGDQGSLSCP